MTIEPSDIERVPAVSSSDPTNRTAKELVDLRELLNGSLSSDLWRIVTRTTSDVRFRIEAPKEALVVHASEPHLVRALTNLVHNAVEAIPDAGEVIIEARAVHLDAAVHLFETIEAGSYAVVAVSDNGRGMMNRERVPTIL